MKKYTTLLLLFFMTLGVQAQENMTELFKNMPDSVLPLLSKTNRLDMVDFMDAQMKAEVTNQLDGKSELFFADKDSIVILIDHVHTVVFYLLGVETMVDSAQFVIGMQHTYQLSSGAKEQTFGFYSAQWRRLSAVPKLSDKAQMLIRLKTGNDNILLEDRQLREKKPVSASF